jgi:protein SOK2
MHSGQPGEQVPHTEEEAEHDHDTEYTHDSGAYDANRAQYNYNAPPVASIPNDHAHLNTEMAGSSHQGGSGRATPRTTAPQSYYGQQGYNTPPRTQQSSSNLYNVMSSDRGPTNGATGADVYAPQPDMSGSMANGYGAQQPAMNGSSSGVKRGRDDEDDRPASVGSMDPTKRRKTFADGSMPSPTYDSLSRPPSAVATQRRR